MHYLVYAARDRYGVFAFIMREDKGPPEWPGLRLEIAGVYAEKDDAERALLEADAVRALRTHALDQLETSARRRTRWPRPTAEQTRHSALHLEDSQLGCWNSGCHFTGLWTPSSLQHLLWGIEALYAYCPMGTRLDFSRWSDNVLEAVAGRVARVVEKHRPSPSGVSTLRDPSRRSSWQIFPAIHPTEAGEARRRSWGGWTECQPSRRG